MSWSQHCQLGDNSNNNHPFAEKIDDLNNQQLKYLYSVSQKSSHPLKLFAIFLLVVNLCDGKLSYLLTKYILTFTPILVHLSEYLYESYHFF